MSYHVAALIWRFGIFSSLWLIFCGGKLDSLLVGLPVISAATWLHLCLAEDKAPRIRPLMLVRFMPFFGLRSLASAVDVMMRVCHPRLLINPGLIEYPLTIDHESGRVLLANCITLLPGTISARLTQDVIIVHTLDKGLPVLAIIGDLEARISKLYAPRSANMGGLS
ncbi:MAG: Na+/H+ antiporter subunit E [Proteobacteria bacterium]|nr:Na+/H+ antiporter subunit E [Pseudomonadota bacterium]MBU1639644.1 Na+/H+ antiporter subunit E [Pseudomonadota bacterium]